MKPRIMYIERKPDGLIGEARIGRVSFSKTGRTLYYAGKSFRSLKSAGIRGNYYEVETGDEFWISGCRQDGADRHYAEPGPVEIDEDVREEYWADVRHLPEKRQRTRT